MRYAMRVASLLTILVITSCVAIAQMQSPILQDEAEDNPRGNVNLSFPVVVPLNPTARAVHLGFGFIVGGGYNLTRRHGLIGEFMWNNLFPTNEALAKIRVALNNQDIEAKSDVMAFTGNYRYELRGRTLGTYFIGGSGLYYRHASISQKVVTGKSITCTPMWQWWGYTCEGGYVTENQQLGSWSATAGGFNGGIGFTARVGDPPYRVYAESRYHYVPNSRVNMQIIDISFGIRY